MEIFGDAQAIRIVNIRKVFKGLYVDIEVADEEYELIGESCDTDMFRGMYEDIALSEICERCLDALGEADNSEENILFRFDYPLETELTGLRLFGKLDLIKLPAMSLFRPMQNLLKTTMELIRFGGQGYAAKKSLAIRPLVDYELIYYGHKEVNSYVWSNNWRHYW